jgi:hypothetical protein
MSFSSRSIWRRFFSSPRVPQGRKSLVRVRLEELESRLAPATLLHSLYPPDTVASQTDGWLGVSTATSTSFCVVGMHRVDIGGVQNRGAAYVYSPSTGALIATLVNPSATDDAFGTSVSVSENTVVVGAWLFDDAGATNSGRAYVFNATTGALIATLANPSPAMSDHFGRSVSVSGNTVVVGADNDNTGGEGSGQAYMFNATTGAVIATLANPFPASGANFGITVSVSGNTAVVGASQVSTTGFLSSGQAYVFNATTGALITTLVNPSPTTNKFFGWSVSVWGNTVVVGASDMSGGSGQAYVFDATTSALIATIANPSSAGNDGFGNGALSMWGNTVVVGAYSDDTDALNSGQAYVFDATTGALIATLANPSPAASNGFGWSVSVWGNTVVVGAPGVDTQNVDQGAAYVFTLDSATPSPPVVTNIAPFVGPITGGITVAINGANFLGVTGPAGVKFGLNNATSYTVDSDTKITAVLPPGAAGTVNVTVTNAAGTSSTTGTADDFQYTTATAPQLLSVTPNGNIPSLAGPQRSRVASLVVVFDKAVQLDANALTLALHTSNVRFENTLYPSGFGTLPASLSVSTTDNITWIVTFTGNTDAGADGINSLKDGVYDLNIDAAKVHPFGTPGVSMAANRTTTFHRLFGDTNAPTTPHHGTPGVDFEAAVNSGDNLVFRKALNDPSAYKAFLDFNGDGVINSIDNIQFRNRFNKPLTWRT